ncbi:cystatin-b [Plakobranchus ocellatus]|uniref:Cystatin-b n=1 Tax=Plakobranchus ocellatus TaxID=259542 RepID=A0AAV3ZXK4_9GAST|nr:cystatin-b [Plakobranchus ocellatus]
MMCGGTSDAKPADAEIQTLIETVREQSEEQAAKKHDLFKAIEYKTQVVAGTNYFVKVQVSDSEFIHLRIFKALPHVNALPKLAGQQLGKSGEDALEYF